MARAVVLIGVSRAGGRYPELPAVPGAVAAVRDWATAQGVPADLLLTFTDDDGARVDAGDVLAGIRTVVERGDVDQLLVYFSGHGINTGNSEFWLLPGAPEDGSQAVNVSLTSWYAERLPVRHVVLVSDACRTAASTTQELGIQGTAIVPNLPPSGPAAAVDVFYACALGDPAYELKDPAASGAAYRALYTSVLVAALRGEHPALVAAQQGGGGSSGAGGGGGVAGFGLVQPWPLKRALPGLVAAHLTAVHAPLDLNQTPDARLSSDPVVAWLSRLEPWPPATPPPGSPAPPGPPPAAPQVDHETAPAAPAPPAAAPAPAPVPPPDAALDAATDPPPARLRAVEAADRLAVGLALATPAPAPAPAPDLELAVAAPPPVVVQGDRVVSVAQVTEGAAVVVLGAGCCAVLPVLPGRTTVATVEDARLVDCALPRTDALGTRTPGLARRALAAAWSRFGLSSDDDEHDATDERELNADPLGALYRAWDLHDRGRRDEVAALARPGAPGERLFDVLLLAQPPDDDPRWAAALTPVPLLARGWALLPAAPDPVRRRALTFPPRLPAHWTMFAAADAPRVVAALLESPSEEVP